MEASPSCQQPNRIIQSTTEQRTSKQELEQVVLVETAYWKILTPEDEYLPKQYLPSLSRLDQYSVRKIMGLYSKNRA